LKGLDIMSFGDLIVVILAGNDEDASLLGGIGQTSKFFMPFGGERVGERILRAVDGLKRCKAVYIAVPESDVDKKPPTGKHAIHHVSQGATQIQSMARAVDEAERSGDYTEGDYVLVVAGDLPLLTTQALEGFIDACEKDEIVDCYLGMIPFAELNVSVKPGYEIEIMSFRGEECLHSDVWLLRPDALTEIGRKRMDQILRIRRLKRDNIIDMLRVGVLLLSIVGPQAIPGFIRTVLSMRRTGEESAESPRDKLDTVERMALDLIKSRFGPDLRLVRVCEPSLALGIDSTEQMDLLLEFTHRSS
jgi:molybdopterin-guanine dinucleotide biosynthesis protein A